MYDLFILEHQQTPQSGTLGPPWNLCDFDDAAHTLVIASDELHRLYWSLCEVGPAGEDAVVGYYGADCAYDLAVLIFDEEQAHAAVGPGHGVGDYLDVGGWR